MTTVIVPWKPGCPHREANWRHVRQHLDSEHPWPILTGQLDDQPWCKGEAVAQVIDEAGDTIVIHDADVIADPEALREAVRAVEGGAPWATPHTTVRRLARLSTEALLAGQPYDRNHVQRLGPYEGMLTGGVVVINHDVYRQTGGFDRRFAGWGGEDTSYGLALTQLAGPVIRGRSELLHLFHPWDGSTAQPKYSDEGAQLVARYRQAFRTGGPEQMRALIEEASPWTSRTSSTSQPR